MTRLPSLTKTMRDVTAAGLTVVGVEITPTGYSLRFGLTGSAAPVADDPFTRAKDEHVCRSASSRMAGARNSRL